MGLQIYDFVSFFFTILLDIFFREIRPRGAHKVPRQGPVIFVAAPHANQVPLYPRAFPLTLVILESKQTLTPAASLCM